MVLSLEVTRKNKSFQGTSVFLWMENGARKNRFIELTDLRAISLATKVLPVPGGP
jgi:hypothetical protein